MVIRFAFLLSGFFLAAQAMDEALSGLHRHEMPSIAYPLMIAAAAGDVAAVTRILNDRPGELNKCNRQRWTALTWAAYNGHAKVIDALFSFNPDTEVYTRRKKYTPLAWAIENLHTAAAAALINGGADIGATGTYLEQNWNILSIVKEHQKRIPHDPRVKELLNLLGELPLIHHQIDSPCR